MYSFQRRQLLTESEVLKKESATGVEQARDYSRHEPNDLYHVAVRNASGLWRATLQLVEIMGEQNFGEAQAMTPAWSTGCRDFWKRGTSFLLQYAYWSLKNSRISIASRSRTISAINPSGPTSPYHKFHLLQKPCLTYF
jgi:hypothetical protein